MNSKYTDVTVILDKSTSMGEIVDATIEGFNNFLDKQKAAASKADSICELQVIQVADQAELGPRVDVQRHPKLDTDSYETGGKSALLDAVGAVIEENGKRFANLPEGKRPAKVAIVLITDGSDTASTHYSADQIRDMIATQRDNFKWDFIFLGAGHDAWASHDAFGLLEGKSLLTTATKRGTKQAFDSLSNYVSHTIQSRTSEEALEHHFSPDELKRARTATDAHA